MNPPLKPVTPNALPSLLRRLILLFLFVSVNHTLAIAFQVNKFYAQPFDTIGHILPNQRVYIATDIYKKNLRHVPEKVAMARLNELTIISRQLDDKALESVVFDLKADYYAVNLKFNQKSIDLFKQAIDFATENKQPLYAAIYLQHEGMFYYNLKRNTDACFYFLKAQEAFKEVGFDKAPNMSAYFSQVAEFYYYLGDYTNAEIELQNALKYPIHRDRDKVSDINTLGLIRRNNKQYSQALAYFQESLKLAKQSKDTVWVGITTGNIGSIYFLLGQYDKAVPAIQADYVQSSKYGEKDNAAIALLRLVKINLIKNNVAQCLKQLDTAGLLIKNSATSVLSIKTDIYDLKAQCYDKMGEPAQSLLFRKKYELTKDSLAIQNNISAVEVVKMQYLITKQQAEDNRLRANARERDAVFIILFLLIVILLLLFSRQTLKARKDKELLQSEKRRLDEELKYTDMKLQTYTEHIRKNNKLIDRFKDQIDQLKNKNADSTVVEHLEKLMQEHIMTDANWQEFKKIFMKMHPNYLFNIKKHFLSLSETDVRLLTLIKLQCTNKEMANMLGITAEGIKKAKQRLRKKMKLEDNTSIEEAIVNL